MAGTVIGKFTQFGARKLENRHHGAQGDNLLRRVDAAGGLQRRPQPRRQGALSRPPQHNFDLTVPYEPDAPLFDQRIERRLNGCWRYRQSLGQRCQISVAITRQVDNNLPIKWWQLKQIKGRRDGFHAASFGQSLK